MTAGLVPRAYLDGEGGGRRLATTFAAATLVRLVLMPIAGHADLLSTYHRSYLLWSEFRPRWWVPHELVQSLWLAICSPFLPLSELLEWQGVVTSSNDFWLEAFAPHPLAPLALFLFKLPYLLADLGVALVLLRLFAATPAKGLAAAKMWLFNPLTIFAFYVFGRHDVIAILFIALGLLWLDRGKPFRGALSIGVALWSRYYAALLLPFLVALHPGGWRKKSLILAAGLLPVTLYNVAAKIGAQGPGIPSVRLFTRSRFSDYLLTFRFDMGSNQILFVFPVVYGMLLLLSLVAPQRGRPTVRFCEFAACCLLALYATTFFHPHYLTWVIPFLVILRADAGSRALANAHYLQVLLFVPYTFYWGEPLFGWLLAPLDPELFGSLPSPWAWIDSFGDPNILLNLFRSLLSAVCLFMVGLILFRGPAAAADPAPAGASIREADDGMAE